MLLSQSKIRTEGHGSLVDCDRPKGRRMLLSQCKIRTEGHDSPVDCGQPVGEVMLLKTKRASNGRARVQPCRKSKPQMRALAPEVRF